MNNYFFEKPTFYHPPPFQVVPDHVAAVDKRLRAMCPNMSGPRLLSMRDYLWMDNPLAMTRQSPRPPKTPRFKDRHDRLGYELSKISRTESGSSFCSYNIFSGYGDRTDWSVDDAVLLSEIRNLLDPDEKDNVDAIVEKLVDRKIIRPWNSPGIGELQDPIFVVLWPFGDLEEGAEEDVGTSVEEHAEESALGNEEEDIEEQMDPDEEE